MSFLIYDAVLLIIFIIFISIFLHSRKEKISREGLLLLYKTSWGIKLIKKFSKKNKPLLKFFAWVSIFLGYFLMISAIYFFGKIVWIYLFNLDFVKSIKIPPIMPLVPYIPRVFNLDFLPPFYFIYWIIIIAIIAIPHEFAHGLYAVYSKVRIKSTGFGFFPYFLPVFLAAFVELDEKELSKKSKFKQMATLSAGTFANVLAGIFFLVLMGGFFYMSYSPEGVVFDNYAYSAINVSDIQTINNVTLTDLNYESILKILNPKRNEIILKNNDKYLISRDFFENSQSKKLFNEKNLLIVYYDAPAINAGLTGAISEIDNVKIKNLNQLSEELSKKSPGQEIIIKTSTQEGEKEYKIVLGKNPDDENLPWLGIVFYNKNPRGFLGRIMSFVTFFRDPYVYYKPKCKTSEFIYNLLWWIVLISFSVALINMLPIGIFDGGRFFYLTILAVTKSESKAKKTFNAVTMLFLFLLLLILFSWVRSLF